MAITAKFQADFSSFSSAVEKAQVELRGFEGSASKVESALSRMTDNFSGRKVIQDATLMAQAVENVGGVTKLTASELQKVGAQAQEAAAKFRAWGQDVPPKIQAIADATNHAETATTSWAHQLNGLAGAFGVTLGAAGLVGFAKSLLDTGDELVRVADRTGLTTVEVQKLQFIAGQSGNSIDELTGAIGKLQKNLTTGEAGAVAAVKQLGLNLEALKSATPYEQIAQIASAIEQIPDPAERATLAMQLFGRSGAAILPSLVSQFQALGDAAPVMSDKTVRALDAAGDALRKFGDTVKVIAAESYNFAGQIFDRMTAAAYQTASGILRFTASFLEIEKHIPGVTTAFNKLGISTEGIRDQAQRWTDTGTLLVSHLSDEDVAIRKVATAVGEFEPKVEKATTAVREHAVAILGLGEGEKTLLGTLQLQQVMLQRYYERLEQLIPAQRNWWDLIAQTDGEIQVLASHTLPQATGAVANLGSGVEHLGTQIASATNESDRAAIGWQGLTTATLNWGTTLKAVGSIAEHVSGTIADLTSIGTAAALAFIGSKSLFETIIIGATLAIQVVAKLWNGIKQLFGGPSAGELAARDEFAKSFSSANDAIEKLGKELGDAGHGGEEARILIQALFDATHVSAAAVDAALQAINDRIASGAAAAAAAVSTVTKNVGDLNAAVQNIPDNPYRNWSAPEVQTPQYFASGGTVLPFAPRGSDTVPAMLTPGEVVLTPAQARGGGGDLSVTTVVTLDGEVLYRQIDRRQQRDLLTRRKLTAA